MNTALLAASIAGATFLLPLVFGGEGPLEEISRKKILEAGPEWRENYDKYEPAADMVDALKSKMGPDIRIDVYLGLWCKDSKNNVPPFLKIIDQIGTAAQVRYFNLPKKEDKEKKYFVEDLKIDRVPTFIAYRGGKEIGRIVENPQSGMIEDLMEIFFREP